MNVIYHRGKQYSYFEIELNNDVSMKFGTLCPHYPSKIWKEIITGDRDMVLKFHSWFLKVSGKDVYFTTPCSQLKIEKALCESAFLKASGDSLYYTNDVMDLC